MKTSTAMLAHSVVGAAQAGAVVGGMDLGLPWWGQLLIQIGLLFGQSLLARQNSKTDPNGLPL